MDTTAIERLLDETLAAAEEAREAGTEPVGSVLARPDGVVVARGRNRVGSDGDPTAHAEIDALRAAGTAVDEPGLVLVTSAEPCLMCLGAILLTPIASVVWATDWVRDSAYASVVQSRYESGRVERLAVVREPSARHRAWTRRLLSEYYERTGEVDLARLLRG